MAKKLKASMSDKEKKLIEKIEKSKRELLVLQEKRRLEIGKLAYKHGLEVLDNKVLNKKFAEIAKEFADGNQG